ncbi:hypothetical protein R4Z09_29205 [Niallia oryzisoli]|uniref:SMP domain-containing protein n=1 Tax=Niallia oryzisoli TaxID=1737571 RepID=A0ABZ2CCI6_9BACI
MGSNQKSRSSDAEIRANQAEASRHQAGSSGKYGTEFASVDNKVTRKIEPVIEQQ